MTAQLRMAEAVCMGHPDRLADTIAARIVERACAHDRDASVAVEVAVHRCVVFIDGCLAAGTGTTCAVSEADIVDEVRKAFRDAGYGTTTSGTFPPDPDAIEVRFDLCLGPLDEERRAIRHVSEDQVVGVGHAVAGPRAGYRPVEQALASDFCQALERLRVGRPDFRLGPDGKSLVVVRGPELVGVSLSVHHHPGVEWGALTRAVREACDAVTSEYVQAGELVVPARVDWLINGAGAFEIGGPMGDNGLSGKKLVAEAYGTAVPIGGGAVHGKDPHKADVRARTKAREMALALVMSGRAREATVWVAYRPGDAEPRWRETQMVDVADRT